jgi:thioredoxin reductase (NADPH)
MKTDLIILGGGPAGLASGMYAARGRIPVLVLEKGIAGGQMAATELVDNYPGFNEPILGYELAQKMESHAKKFGLEIVQTDIRSVSVKKDGFLVVGDSGDEYESKAIILATGASPVKPGIPGEKELAGRGVSYCAVCDGPFFKDLEVAVIGGGDSAVEESVYLSRFATRVHIVHRRNRLRAVKEIQERAFAQPKLTFHWNSVPVRIIGEKDVQGLVIRSVTDGSESLLPVGGVFFYVGIHANTQSFSDLVETDEGGFVITDEKMRCSRPGVFAAGDVRSKILRQIATAVGDGATAAYSAQQYLESL